MTQPDATMFIGALIALVILGVAFTTAGFVFSRAWLLIMAAIWWAGVTAWGFLARTNWTAGSLLANAFIWAGIGATLVCFLSAIWMGYRSRPERPPEESDEERYAAQLDEQSRGIRKRRSQRLRDYDETHPVPPYGA